MGAKLKSLLGSLRFWQLTLAAGAEILALAGPAQGTSIYHIIAMWLVGVAAIGTIDKAAQARAARDADC
jgi:hypothetical protein